MAKKKSNLRYYIIGVVVLLILVIVANKAGWIGKGDVVKVATEKVEIKTVNETVSASGKVQPEKEVKLSSEVSGEIVELNIKEGDIVKQGQVLCRVKPDILQSGYDRAIASLNAQKASLAAAQQQLIQNKASFDNIEANYNRNQELFNKKVISASEFEKIRAEYEGAKANLAMQEQNVLGAKYGIDQSNAMVKEAADNLSRTTIYAPVDGVVSLLSVELGERVVGTAQMAGTEIMRIANMSSMEVNVDVNENDINRISVGNDATIEVDAFQGRKFTGTVTEIASSSTGIATTSSADQVTNFMVKVRISPDSYADILGDNKLTSPFRPGLSATVDIHTEKDSGLSVPIQAVTTREISKDKSSGDADQNVEKDTSAMKNAANLSVEECVFVYKNGEVILKPVKTGIQDDQYIRILSGLSEGEEVVISPFTAISKTLKDGMQVEKVDKDKLF
jgi:HlyD family secretion protein